MELNGTRPWYIMLVVAWAVFIAPGVILGLFYSGGTFAFEYQSTTEKIEFALILLVFLLPLILFPLRKRPRSE